MRQGREKERKGRENREGRERRVESEIEISSLVSMLYLKFPTAIGDQW